MNIKENKSIKDFAVKALAVLTAVIPFGLSVTIFTGFSIHSIIITALILILYFSKTDSKKCMPLFAVFLAVMFISETFGADALFFALIAAAVVALCYFFFEKNIRLRSNPVTAGFELATALTVTVMLTTYYFGIGASGTTVKEMIASYLSLGFHPNWRGVLYGTIVMVIIITFPRKFKNFCKAVKAPFIAIIFTLLLNLFLNPSDMPTAISEINNFHLNSISFSLGLLGRIPVHSLAVILIVGAWESVNWGEIKKAFSSPVSIICFILSVVPTLYFGYVYGIVTATVLYLIYNLYFKKSNKKISNQSV